MPFEVFKKRFAPLVKQPYVTLQKKGIMSINKAAYLALGSPEAIELLYDREAKIIGLRPVEPSVEHAYPIRNAGDTSANAFLLSGTAFTHYYEIPTPTSVRYPATIEEGMLRIDLKLEGTEVTSNRSGRTKNSIVGEPLTLPDGLNGRRSLREGLPAVRQRSNGEAD
jgi:hypothetical protein